MIGVWIGLYFLIGAGTAFYVWTDAEFRPIDRTVFAVLGLLVWPVALPWYIATRPASLVQDKTYGQSHQHYLDYVKSQGKDIGEGLDETLKRSEEKIAEQRAAALRREKAAEEEPEVKTVVLGGDSGGPGGGWGNIQVGKPAPRTSYGSNTEMMESVRSKIYGTEGHAFSDATAVNPELVEPEGGWKLATPGAPAPMATPPAPAQSGWNTAAPSGGERPTQFRLRLYGDDSAPEAASAPPPASDTVSAPVDNHLEHLMRDGQLREALTIAQRLLERTAAAGDSKRQAMYLSYVQTIEQRLQDETLIDD